MAWQQRPRGDHGGYELACGACGLSLGGPMAVMTLGVSQSGGDDEDWEEPDWDDDDSDLEADAARATFPVYAVAGLPATIADVGGEPGAAPDSVAVKQGDIEVESELPDREWGTRPRDLRAALEHVVVALDDDADASMMAFQVRWAVREREGRERVEAASEQHWTFVIDGIAEPFEVLASGSAWAARRDHYGTFVTVAARDVDPASVALERLVDLGDPSAGTTPEPTVAVAQAQRAARGIPLSRAEVTASLKAHGLGEHRDCILDAVQAGYALVPGEGPVRVGGLPDLAPGEEWPHDEDGIPYTFIAQIDCSALLGIRGDFPPPAWDHGGKIVRVFAALDARMPEPGPALALNCPPGTPLVRAELPPRPDPMPDDAWEPDDESNRQLAERVYALRPMLSVPIGWWVLPDPARELLADEFEAFARTLAPGVDPDADRPQLLGHAVTMQGEDPRGSGSLVFSGDAALEPQSAWQLLLNLPDGFDFGDGGALGLVIPLADLAVGRYDRIVTEPSMG